MWFIASNVKDHERFCHLVTVLMCCVGHKMTHYERTLGCYMATWLQCDGWMRPVIKLSSTESTQLIEMMVTFPVLLIVFMT